MSNKQIHEDFSCSVDLTIEGITDSKNEENLQKTLLGKEAESKEGLRAKATANSFAKVGALLKRAPTIYPEAG